MPNLFRRLAQFVLVVRWPLLLGLGIITLICGFKAVQLQIDPTVDMMLAKNTKEYKDYDAYRRNYGSDAIILVAMSTDNVFTPENLDILKRVTETCLKFEQVESVLSLPVVSDIRHKMFGVKIVPALEGVLEGSRPMAEARSEILSNELYLNNLVSHDGKTANLIIRVKTSKDKESGLVIERLKSIFRTEEKRGVKFYMAGAPVEQYEFVRLIRKDQFTFVPMITAFLIAAIFLFYRSVPCVILALSKVFVTLAWTFGTIAFFGQELNLVTSLLAPVLMIITVVNSIHFMNLFFDIRAHHHSLRMSVVLTMEQLGLPSLLTHATTILGFLSLAVDSVPAIRSFGVFAALGSFYSLLVAMFLTPVMLLSLPYRAKPRDFDDRHFFNKVLVGFLEKLEHRWKWVILASVVVSVVFSISGIRKLNVDTNIVRQLKPDSPLAVSTRFIDDHILGVYTLGFVLRTRDGSTIVNRETLQRLDAFKTFLEQMPEISNVNSITTLIKRIHLARKQNPEAYEIPGEVDLERYFKGITSEDNPETWSMMSRDLKEVRLQAQMKAVGTREGKLVEKKARAYMQKKLSPYFETLMTGNVVLLGRMAENLVHSQIMSFGFAFASIFLVIAVIFRSLKMGLLAAVPNIVPILLTYGIMGYLRIELSTSTAMISSIVLGLVVDSSIRFLHRFQLEFEKRGHYLQALHHTYRNTGQALFISTLILVVGFGTSLFAGFRPTIQFGVLTSLTIFLSMICTLLVLPVLVVMTRPFGHQRLFRKHKESIDPFR